MKFRDTKYNIKYMLEYGSLSLHLKECFINNKYYIIPINFLGKEHRYLGFEFDWYDGPHYSFGFWWFNISSSPKYFGDITKKKPTPNSIQFIKDNFFIKNIKYIKKYCQKNKKNIK